MLEGKHILLGVTGGIAAYKSVSLLRSLQKLGAEVRVTATPSALRFVGLDTFKSLSRNEVAVEVFSDNPQQDWAKHVHWGEWADLFVIAPCTANTMAKIRGGFSDNMLTATVLASRCPILLCPTMDGEMFTATSTQRNLQQLIEDGFHILEPEDGYLASGLEAKGRLPDENVILDKIKELLQVSISDKKLQGKKVVVTAGATREFLDPIRFISNPSSGKMGLAMAKAASKLGAEVTFIHGAIQVDVPDYIKRIEITSAEDLFEAIQKVHSETDIAIFSAAVSDYTPITSSNQKIKKSGDELEIKLKRTPDSLAWFGQNKNEGQIAIGFAMETEDLLINAGKKLVAKNADYIIANTISDSNQAFGSDVNAIVLLSHSNKPLALNGTKEELAHIILESIDV